MLSRKFKFCQLQEKAKFNQFNYIQGLIVLCFFKKGFTSAVTGVWDII